MDSQLLKSIKHQFQANITQILAKLLDPSEMARLAKELFTDPMNMDDLQEFVTQLTRLMVYCKISHPLYYFKIQKIGQQVLFTNSTYVALDGHLKNK